MSTIFWLLAIYFIGKRWLKKHPDAQARLTHYLNGRVGKSRPSRPKTSEPPSRTDGAAKPQPPLLLRKKAEKQFQQL